MNCPNCGSSNTKMYDDNWKRDSYLCRDCRQKWTKTNARGVLRDIGSTVLTVGAIFVGADHLLDDDEDA